MTVRYEVIGTVDRSVVGSFTADPDLILIDDGDDELLIAQPASDGDE
ncbi:hypothetical protein [Halopiger goleimassiliensis]|nr:hypothetical protein [Halopiger goleimassiliensis]